MKHILKLSMLAVVLGSTSFAAPQAHAAIKCQGGYQIVKGVGAIATPYCQDMLLTHLARKAGLRTTLNDVRSSLKAKEEACTVIGEDIRIADTCHAYVHNGG